jgi:hypothetical protein
MCKIVGLSYGKYQRIWSNELNMKWIAASLYHNFLVTRRSSIM